MQTLEMLTNETNKSLTDKKQALEKHTNKNIQTQTEKFRAELGLPLHYEIEEECPKVTRKPTSIYPVIIQEKSPNDRHPQGYEELTGILCKC